MPARWCIVVLVGVAPACGRIDFEPQSLGDAATSTDVPTAASCGGLAPTCGPAGTAPCCGDSLVPGGSFYRSYDVGTDAAYAVMTNPATVSDFRLDTYEVTVGRFRQFVAAGMGTQQNPPAAGAGARTLNGTAAQGGWDPAWNANLAVDSAALMTSLHCAPSLETWTDAPAGNEAMPLDCVSWYAAFAFCVWDGGFLPTEAEWNFAATGGAEQRAFPWSVPASSIAIDCTDANYYESSMFCVGAPDGALSRVGAHSPQGDGRWGHADLAGNVWEWTLDAWTPNVYINPCDDCAELSVMTPRGIRGGSYGDLASNVRTANRYGATPANYPFDVGVRCARRP